MVCLSRMVPILEIVLGVGFIAISLLIIKRYERVAPCFLVVYFLSILYLAFISREPVPYLRYNVTLFGAAKKGIQFGGGVIQGFLMGSVKIINWESIGGIVLNMLLFVPFGYLIPTLFHRFCWWKVILLGFVFSLCIELLQLITHLGFADVDDLINNTFGTMLGWLCYRGILKGKEK